MKDEVSKPAAKRAVKKRAALTEAGGSKGPPRAPVEVGAAPSGPRRVMSILVTGVPVEVATGLDRVRASRGLRSRNELIVSLLAEVVK